MPFLSFTDCTKHTFFLSIKITELNDPFNDPLNPLRLFFFVFCILSTSHRALETTPITLPITLRVAVLKVWRGGSPEVLRPFREPMRSKLRNCSISCLFHPPAPRSSSGASCWMQRRCVWLSHPAVSKCWVQNDPRSCKHNRSIPNTRQTSTFFFFFWRDSAVCGSSQAKNQTHLTAMAQVIQ